MCVKLFPKIILLLKNKQTNKKNPLNVKKDTQLNRKEKNISSAYTSDALLLQITAGKRCEKYAHLLLDEQHEIFPEGLSKDG